MDQMAPKAKLTDEEKNWVLALCKHKCKNRTKIIKELLLFRAALLF